MSRRGSLFTLLAHGAAVAIFVAIVLPHASSIRRITAMVALIAAFELRDLARDLTDRRTP